MNYRITKILLLVVLWLHLANELKLVTGGRPEGKVDNVVAMAAATAVEREYCREYFVIYINILYQEHTKHVHLMFAEASLWAYIVIHIMYLHK